MNIDLFRMIKCLGPGKLFSTIRMGSLGGWNLVAVADGGWWSFCLQVSNQLMVTLPETNSSHLKMDGWNTTFLLGMAYFQGLC